MVGASQQRDLRKTILAQLRQLSNPSKPVFLAPLRVPVGPHKLSLIPAGSIHAAPAIDTNAQQIAHHVQSVAYGIDFAVVVSVPVDGNCHNPVAPAQSNVQRLHVDCLLYTSPSPRD